MNAAYDGFEVFDEVSEVSDDASDDASDDVSENVSHLNLGCITGIFIIPFVRIRHQFFFV